MKRILVIQGHPVKDTFTDCLKDKYVMSAIAAGAEVKEIVLRDLNFEINFKEGYRGSKELETDIIEAQKLISWAEHLVFVYPNWWSTYPALLKGFIDRTFLPGFAFKYISGKAIPEKLLKGKTARLIVSMDSPPWYYHLFKFAPGHHAMRLGLLHFCGIKPVWITSIGPVRGSTEKQRNRWIQKIERIAGKLQ
jgi:putative NADPH-quinone reductase